MKTIGNREINLVLSRGGSSEVQNISKTGFCCAHGYHNHIGWVILSEAKDLLSLVPSTASAKKK
jgi:hypothetical protein